MKKPALDWRRVAEILGSNDPEAAMATCRRCAAKGSVPYIAEHVLTAHPDSREGRQIAKMVLERDKPRAT